MKLWNGKLLLRYDQLKKSKIEKKKQKIRASSGNEMISAGFYWPSEVLSYLQPIRIKAANAFAKRCCLPFELSTRIDNNS